MKTSVKKQKIVWEYAAAKQSACQWMEVFKQFALIDQLWTKWEIKR